MVATWAAPLDMAVARCREPVGAICGNSADSAGLSNAPAMPSTKVATKICTSFSVPAQVLHARNKPVAASAS